MKQYTFTCPLEGCGMGLSTHAQTKEIAAKELTEEAKKHLLAFHPDVHKTPEEVSTDITTHMTEIEQSK